MSCMCTMRSMLLVTTVETKEHGESEASSVSCCAVVEMVATNKINRYKAKVCTRQAVTANLTPCLH